MANHDLRALAMAACTSLLLTACTGISNRTYAYKLYPGPTRASSEIAIVQLSGAPSYKFNGRPVSRKDWTEVQLLPGAHEVQVWIDYSSVNSRFATSLVLEAGHVYSPRMSITGWSKQVTYFWVVDNSTGRTIAGTPEP